MSHNQLKLCLAGIWIHGHIYAMDALGPKNAYNPWDPVIPVEYLRPPVAEVKNPAPETSLPTGAARKAVPPSKLLHEAKKPAFKSRCQQTFHLHASSVTGLLETNYLIYEDGKNLTISHTLTLFWRYPGDKERDDLRNQGIRVEPDEMILQHVGYMNKEGKVERPIPVLAPAILWNESPLRAIIKSKIDVVQNTAELGKFFISTNADDILAGWYQNGSHFSYFEPAPNGSNLPMACPFFGFNRNYLVFFIKASEGVDTADPQNPTFFSKLASIYADSIDPRFADPSSPEIVDLKRVAVPLL